MSGTIAGGAAGVWLSVRDRRAPAAMTIAMAPTVAATGQSQRGRAAAAAVSAFECAVSFGLDLFELEREIRHRLVAALAPCAGSG